MPLTFMETYALTECTAELSTCCYMGMLMLRAMGLGGWMFDGIDRYTVLGPAATPSAGIGLTSVGRNLPDPGIRYAGRGGRRNREEDGAST